MNENMFLKDYKIYYDYYEKIREKSVNKIDRVILKASFIFLMVTGVSKFYTLERYQALALDIIFLINAVSFILIFCSICTSKKNAECILNKISPKKEIKENDLYSKWGTLTNILTNAGIVFFLVGLALIVFFLT